MADWRPGKGAHWRKGLPVEGTRGPVPPHGTVARYNSKNPEVRCRACDACKLAWKRYRAERRRLRGDWG